jgi:hypothetical protein
MSDAVQVYECGNFESIHSDPPETCPHCGAEERDRDTIDPFKTVTVTCEGWYPEDD